MATWRTWRAAMTDALYGDNGFYARESVPAQHFRTAAHASPAWAAAIATLAARVDVELGETDDFTVVDLGAGGGELLSGVAAIAPERWRLLGVDVALRPESLPARVGWSAQMPATFAGLLIAVEWLDVVPVDVVEQTGSGPRLVEVDPQGEERLGTAPSDPDRAWLERWWPLADIGDRAEVGRPRDEAWAGAVARLRAGLAAAVDYAAVPARDLAGTLTGYREGRQIAPVPDGSMDVTAHVLIESCVAATTADEVTSLTQRDALRALGLDALRPSYDGDPARYLRELSQTGEAAELLDPHGLGDFAWLLAAKGMSLPI